MQTSAAYKMRVFPGDHFFFQSQKKEFISTLRRDLIETLDV
jgi:surfactin synthase thioesterase subunit